MLKEPYEYESFDLDIFIVVGLCSLMLIILFILGFVFGVNVTWV